MSVHLHVNKHFGSRQMLCGLVKYITWLQYSYGIQTFFLSTPEIYYGKTKILYLAGRSLHI